MIESPLPPAISRANRTEPRKRVDRIFEECVGSDLDSWEHFTFLPSIARRFVLTENQEKRLAEIEARVFGSDDD